MENTNAFPVRKITVKLKKTDPTRLTPENLQQQMYGIGLKCEDTSIANLTKSLSQNYSCVDCAADFRQTKAI